MEFKRKISYFFIILLITANCRCQAKEILCLFGVATETAEKWNKVLLTALASKGHSLTVITPTMKWDLESKTNINVIFLENTQKNLKQRYENQNITSLLEQSIWKFLINWYDQQMATCQGNLESTGFSEALHLGLHEKLKIDLIVYDLTYGPGCLLHLAYLFKNAPIVGITSSTLTTDILKMNHYYLNPALDSFVLSDFKQNMNYWQRLYNTALYAFDYFYRQYVVRPVIEGMWSQNSHVKNIKVPKSIDALLPRFKLILANHHPALHTFRALSNNIIPVPGLHIDMKLINPLNDKILKFMNDYPLGSVLIDLDVKQFNENVLQNILKVIDDKFPNYGFIWLTGKQTKSMKNKPHNLIMSHKFQNQDILSQQNRIKCFITIPEILRLQESLYYGMPMITITQKPEHGYLAKRAVEQGFALNIPSNNFDSFSFEYSLQHCLNDKSLIMKSQQLQQSLRYPQKQPLETAVWWLETVMENPKFNDHLLSSGNQSLGYFTSNSLDILLLIQILILICVVNTILVCRQTFLNLKKISKANRRQVERNDKKLKKEKKNKSKTV